MPKRGTKAELHEVLATGNFSYVRTNAKRTLLTYKNQTGEERHLKLVKRGLAARATGRKVGLVRLHATPDIWEIQKRKR